MEGLYMAALAIGSLTASGLVAGAGTRWALAITGAVLPLVVLATWRRIAAIDRSAHVPDRELSIIRTVPIFAALPPYVLETVASHLAPVEVRAGTTVLREGAPGDRFYVVERGELEVRGSGQVLSRIGPGGSFGEIALLRNVPRTASVVATTDASLLALEREVFLEAVTGHPASAEAADRVIAEHLRHPQRSP
jgi:hypothetical protein